MLFAVNLLPSRVRRGRFEGWCEIKRTVLSSMTTSLSKGARLIGVPSTLIPDPLGSNVFPSMTDCEKGFAVTISVPRVITGRVASCSNGSSALG